MISPTPGCTTLNSATASARPSCANPQRKTSGGSLGAKFLDLRIGISGSASVGKTTLAKAISEALAVTLLPEEMRDYLERTQAPFARLPEDAATQALWHLWRTRAAKERETP